MEDKATIYKSPGIYKDFGTIYNGNGVYNSGYGGGGNTVEIGGRKYPIVEINGVTWMAENLDYAWPGLIGSTGNPTVPAAWYYNGDSSTYGYNGRKCGLLYNGHAVRHLEANKNTLIPGWHVPDDSEWNNLFNVVGGTSVGGEKLKAADLDWASSWGGIDEYGFKALPAGYRYYTSYYQISTNAYMWSSRQISSNSNSAAYFTTGIGCGIYSGNVTNHAYSIRLVKD